MEVQLPRFRRWNQRRERRGAAIDPLVLHIAEDGDNFKLIWSGYKSGDPDP